MLSDYEKEFEMKVKDLVNRFSNRRFAVYYNDLLLAVFDDIDDLRYYQKQILDFEVDYFRYYDETPIVIEVKGVKNV